MPTEHNFLKNTLSFILHVICIGLLILMYNFSYTILDKYYIQYQCYSWFQANFLFCNHIRQIRSMLDFISNHYFLILGTWYFYPLIKKILFN